MKRPGIYLITRLKDFLDEYKPQKYNWGYNSDSKEIFCNVCESVRPYYSPTFAVYINESFYSLIFNKAKVFNLKLDELLENIKAYKKIYNI